MVVVIDCNIWITLALNRQANLIATFQENDITVATCQQLLRELLDVITRPKFERYFSKAYIDKFFQVYNLNTVTFSLKQIDDVVADKKDNYLFALSKADYFVKGDKLLLQVNKYENTSVISFAEFKMLIA
ncbi:putative toxin-antitoxin system toxin component, PIN family [Mucilaginibacter phyllosphaerae]|uniref:Putative toxin-antitoxin system toxin component, PIN family n=1 Tax=Mucilaginibacter phyllosphaerae TaxID=1812349 RepID=A0A4Y8AKD6_9SPHI|nr:putative toxin-antitoxin system toxin component, PIN family [Mucilaginibacter phyllosphaerae]MBB3967431.1 hypothetical protein [Mucilaginibacter phyllosphaerae]TEW69500.1 putative toxin-antitoxin system toxin component, PIN family [Mucilaginibacter phyllosphaerae]GGH20668.1 hypothetical protein GCM10007352_32830 [Mucilaginibacter phyllosphaerae]